MDLRQPTQLGRTGLSVGRLGLASSFGVKSPDVERAFEHGVNYFYWGSYRRSGFGKAVAGLAQQHRERMVIAVQSYTRVAGLMGRSVESALRKLKIDHADVLILGWWNELPPERILDAARALRASGKVSHLLISCHDRPRFQQYAQLADVGALMVRYNAAHPGAETEVFPVLGQNRPGVVSYTATRWSDLLNPALTPAGEPTPRASDCYRFCLSHPSVDVCLAGPKNGTELDEALQALERGPMSEDELAWMKRVGVKVKQHVRAHSASISVLDRMMGARTG
jgi:aryl-alcohol dehydrogenase-like predicted oxidoreductase